MTRAGAARLLRLAAAGGLLGAAGCGDDFLNPGGETAIQGTVHLDRAVDPAESGVFGLGLGVAYTSVAGEPGILEAAQTEGVILDDPYPNPVATPESTPLTVVVDADGPRTGTLGIWQVGREFSVQVAVLETDGFAMGENRYAWNGRETGSGLPVPNGRYVVRAEFAVPGGSPGRLEKTLVVNRPMLDVVALQAFNVFSEGDGSYAIYEVAVGTTFTRTAANGAVLGAGRLEDRVTLFIDDRDFFPVQTQVELGEGDIATVDLPVTPRASTAPLDPVPTMADAGAFTGPVRP